MFSNFCCAAKFTLKGDRQNREKQFPESLVKVESRDLKSERTWF